MGIYRWYSAALLVVVIATSANAATITIPVAKKSVEDLLKAANPVLNENPLGYVQAYDSPFQYQQRPYSVPVQQKITIPTPAIKDALKGALKQQAAVAAASAAISAAVAAAGWVIDTAGQPVKKVETETAASGTPGSGDYYWSWNGAGSDYSFASTSGSSACSVFASKFGHRNPSASQTGQNTYSCTTEQGPVSSPEKQTYYMQRYGSRCPADSSLNSAGSCVSVTSSSTPVTDSDYENLTSYIDGQGSDMKARLAREACAASTSPQRCYQALQDAASFLNNGPSTIQGPTSNSTTTHKNADGTISTTTTDSDTKFKVQYNSEGATVTPEKTTTTKNPDGSTSETVEKEEDNSTTVQKPAEPEEEEENPLDKEYTFTNPDMPEVPSFYEQKYPDGLKSVWDDNKSRFDNSAFISFMKSFVPSFSGSCPTWGLPMNIMAQASYGYVTFANICYVFDFVKVVIIATAVFTARKIMFGG